MKETRPKLKRIKLMGMPLKTAKKIAESSACGLVLVYLLVVGFCYIALTLLKLFGVSVDYPSVSFFDVLCSIGIWFGVGLVIGFWLAVSFFFISVEGVAIYVTEDGVEGDDE